MTTEPSVALGSAEAKGHVMYGQASMVQGEDARWDCRVCRCWVWVRQHGAPYGTALSACCSTLVGRGLVSCDACSGRWDWPGTFGDEQEARAYLRQHVCGRTSMRVTVLAGPSSSDRTTGGEHDDD